MSKLVTLFLAGLAVLIGMSRVMVHRLAAQTKQKVVEAELNLLHQQIQTMREKTDVETQELVNTILQQYMEEKEALQSRVKDLEIAGIKERNGLNNKIKGLRQQLQETRATLQKRIEELEAVVEKKDSRIAELERKLTQTLPCS